MKNYIKSFLRRLSEKKRLKTRKKEIETICLTIRSYVCRNIHRVSSTRKMIWLTEFKWDIARNGKNYRIELTEMVRGDLIRLTEESGELGRTLVEFGDQSRAYPGFLGLSKDLYCVDDFNVEELKKIIGEQ